MLVKWSVVCTDEEGLNAHTSLQQILGNQSLEPIRLRRICDELFSSL